ncbi:uncharacterized protein PGRI_061280 [Penicillium griseofulvum]|uniref:Uncharacterized protein n=1 Tax=Penicillium patulum TaxID=5078 RepID=A0A135LMF8_PENPA|nr:uncharacterized protein PGRI_061280 [Penicillium griseofulvum]KXG50161.1 hypothetical protein PGRI_061280 [Penicillium griseofulvum]
MKLFLKGTAVLALLIAKASAAQNGIFAANGVELQTYQFGEDTIIGEPQSMVQVNYQLTLTARNGNF